jgi:hypothetical protein
MRSLAIASAIITTVAAWPSPACQREVNAPISLRWQPPTSFAGVIGTTLTPFTRSLQTKA